MTRAVLLLLFSILAVPEAFGQPAILDEIGIDEQLDAQVPLDAVFRDDSGRSVTLGSFLRSLGGKPVLLALVYYRCPMLCGEVLEGLAHALEAMPLEPGKDFGFLAVSFDPAEGPEEATRVRREKASLDRRLGGREASRFLTGREDSIDSLTAAVGFRYVASGDGSQFAHAGGLVALTPEGRVSRYFYGIEYAPRDLHLAILEASRSGRSGRSRVGSPVDRLLLYCYQYDPKTGRYGLVVMRVLRLTGIATVFALGSFVGFALHRERRHRGVR